VFGQAAHEQIAELLQNAAPNVNFRMAIDPGKTGVDIAVPSANASSVGFAYGEIKPLSSSGLRTFNQQVNNWNLPIPVQGIAYDASGNIYLGFPGIK
jgi:hypothetical protein